MSHVYEWMRAHHTNKQANSKLRYSEVAGRKMIMGWRTKDGDSHIRISRRHSNPRIYELCKLALIEKFLSI